MNQRKGELRSENSIERTGRSLKEVKILQIDIKGEA